MLLLVRVLHEQAVEHLHVDRLEVPKLLLEIHLALGLLARGRAVVDVAAIASTLLRVEGVHVGPAAQVRENESKGQSQVRQAPRLSAVFRARHAGGAMSCRCSR